jgi:excisionase family DNA binding protein
MMSLNSIVQFGHGWRMTHTMTESKPVAAVDAGTRLLRLGEVAERLAISKSMAWKLVACGQIHSLRIGRAVRVRPVDLEAYLAQAGDRD